jgi:hypothetical protein
MNEFWVYFLFFFYMSAQVEEQVEEVRFKLVTSTLLHMITTD